MTSLSTNWRTISVIAFCSSVFSVRLVATAIAARGYSAQQRSRSVAARMARDERLGLAQCAAPARPGAGTGRIAVAHRGVEAQSGDDHVGVAAVRVDRDPLARTLPAPAHHRAGRERRAQEATAEERVRDGPRAVVAAVEP